MVSPPSLRDTLAAAASPLDLAQRLGLVCVEHEGELTDLLAQPAAKTSCTNLELAVGEIADALFPERDPVLGYQALLGLNEIEQRVDLMEETLPPLAHLAVLRGLCMRQLRQWFVGTEDCLRLTEGTPIPFVRWPIPEVYEEHTPGDETFNRGRLLAELPFTLFKRRTGSAITVELDYRVRSRIDALTWTTDDTDPLPRIATVHPFLGADGLQWDEPDDVAGTFFGVRPRWFDLEAVLAHLRAAHAAGAEIAVLPELSLPADAVPRFEQRLAEASSRYPAIVVGGSAHVTEPAASGNGAVRANEARVYLDGRRVSTHRKIHAFATKALGTTAAGGALEEAITPGPKTITLLSGRHTRLAVLICSDLVDKEIAALLVETGVNFLLVPSLTFEAGSFNGAICGVASYCQGVAVIVNADLDPLVDDWRKRPFRVMAALPQPREREQSRSFPRWIGPRRPMGLFDPNRGLRRAMSWPS